MSILITSEAFKNQEAIPREYTCDGKDISPPLAWSNIPKDTKSLTLIVDDPDAPKGIWVHWIVYNIPPHIEGFKEDLHHSIEKNGNMRFGKNNFNTTKYGGPCPPGGTHHYHFKLYALDCILDLPSGKSKSDIEHAMEGHVLDSGELVGVYKRV